MIGECPINSRWVETAYKGSTLRDLKMKPVLCAGVTLGKFDEVLAYTTAMSSEIRRKALKAFGTIGIDQAIHNKILHIDKEIACETSRNGDELIATLHYSDLSEFSCHQTRGLLTKEAQPVKIVHQYDRHEMLVEWINRIHE